MITRRRLLALASAVLSLLLWSRVTGARKSEPDPEGVFQHWVLTPAEARQLADQKDAEGDPTFAAILRYEVGDGPAPF